MLDQVVLFSKTGAVVFMKSFTDATPFQTTAIVNSLITTVLLTPTTATKTTNLNSLNVTKRVVNGVAVEWLSHHVADLIIVVTYQAMLFNDSSMAYVAILMEKAMKKFVSQFGGGGGDRTLLDSGDDLTSKFDSDFVKILHAAEGGDFNSEISTNMNIAEINRKMKSTSINNSNNNKKMALPGGKKKITKKQADALDFSAAVGEDGEDLALKEAQRQFMPNEEEPEIDETYDSTLSDDEEGEAEGEGSGGKLPEKGSWAYSFKSLLDTVSGNKVLQKEDLQPQLDAVRDKLVAKNVAMNIATEIVDEVGNSLDGVKLGSFGVAKNRIRISLETAIERVLTPNEKVDLLRDVIRKRERGRGKPYVIAMIGINGVGKSTSLAKIAYYLKKNGCNPMMAACDTFRAGAVEQLGVHAACLEVPIFKKGYGKDPSAVATEAIHFATKEGHDVVLVDTAGRMQSNIPLMNALSKLVVENNPDLVLFVGEALGE